MSQFGLFDFSDRLAALSAFGNPLERLSQSVDFRPMMPFSLSFPARKNLSTIFRRI